MACCLRRYVRRHSGPNRVGAAATVADSKRAFHAAFPHVISPVHRRLVDELLVELHLLSHQQGFQADPLFCVGLVQVFDAFSRGYRPDGLRLPLFDARARPRDSRPGPSVSRARRPSAPWATTALKR